MPTRSTPNSFSHYRTKSTTTVGGNTIINEDARSTEKWFDTVTFGDNVKDWRKCLREGRSATTTMQGVKVQFRYTPGYGKWELPKVANPNAAHFLEMTGNMEINMTIPGANPSLISDTKSNAEALGQFNQRVREVFTAFQGGVFLGELGQTIRTIKSPAQGLRRAVDKSLPILRRIRRDGFRSLNSLNKGVLLERTTRTLAETWLELQYGWRPMLNDLRDGSKALGSYMVGQSLKTQRVSAKSETSAAGNLSSVTNTDSFRCWRIDTVTKDNCIVVYRGAVRVDAVAPGTLDPKLVGFDLSNFLPTCWELIPYSFLIDYFTNIGDIIEGWSQLGIKLAWCNRTVKRTIVKTSSSYSDLNFSNQAGLGGLIRVAFTPATSVIESSVVTRGEFTGIRNPDFVFRLPSLGSKRWLNIAALIGARQDDRNWSYGD